MRKYPVGWNSVGFDDLSWAPAKMLRLDPALPVILSDDFSDMIAYCPDGKGWQSCKMRFRTIPFLDEKRHSCVDLLAEGES